MAGPGIRDRINRSPKACCDSAHRLCANSLNCFAFFAEIAAPKLCKIAKIPRIMPDHLRLPNRLEKPWRSNEPFP